MTKEDYRNNIIKFYSTIQKPYKPEHLNWYLIEHKWLTECSNKYEVPLILTCAICSVLSINKRWSTTKKVLIDYLKHDLRLHTSAAKDKIKRIEECTLDDECILNILRGPKIKDFYLCLLYPDNDYSFVVDRHMAIIAGEYKRPERKRYQRIKDAYIEVSKELGFIPNNFQALLWCNYLNL